MATSSPTSDSNRRNQQSMANRGRLTPGTCYEGTIHSCNYSDMTYKVVVPGGETVENVRDGTGLFNGLIGIKTTHRLSPGTKVMLAHDTAPWIIATIPADVPDLQAYLSRTSTGKGYPKAIKTNHPNSSEMVPEHNMAEDLYEGEFEMANLLGGFLRFLTFMVSIGVDERNQIEFHMARDLTRVLSHNFEFFACDGDRKIYDDGRLNCETNTTTYDHERMGALDPFSEKSPVTEAGMPADLDPKRTGRWRYTRLQGFIGDFINSFITDPAAVLGSMTEEAVRSGKSRVHMGQDGTILLQSVAEIAFERVCRIQVPIRLKHEEDPKGVLRVQMDQLDKSFLKIWNQDSGKSEHHTLFKIREYVRYLNQYQSLARLHQLAAKGEEWRIPREDETPAPLVNGAEPDRDSANQGSTTYWKDAYATIRIMRDGSILNFDAYGNSTASGPYGIQHSSARHYHVWAAGDIVMKAGASMFLSARRHIEIVAARGGLVLKARTFLRGLCERGTLWLKSDYDPDNEYSPEADGDPEAEVVGKQGIRIQATKGESRWLSNRKARFLVEKAGDGENLEFGSQEEIQFSSKKDTGFDIGGNLMMNVRENVSMVCQDFILQAKSFVLPGMASFKQGEATIARIKTSTLASSGPIYGPTNTGQVVNPEDRQPLRAHTNHIQVYDGDTISVPSSGGAEVVTYNFKEADPVYWKLLPEDEYQWVNAPAEGVKADADQLFEPLTQQQLRLDVTAGYAEWDNACDNLLPGPQTANTASWPGTNRKWLIHSPILPTLSAPATGEAAAFKAGNQSALTQGPVKFRFLTR